MRIIWERDGNMVDDIILREGPNYQLEYRISQVEQVHQGDYTCRAVLTPQLQGSTVTVPPVSAGMLTVIGRCLLLIETDCDMVCSLQAKAQ